MATKRRLNTLNLQQKVEIIREVEKGCKKKSKIAAEFGIISSTLSTILKNKNKVLKAFESEIYEPNRKRLRSTNYPDLEVALMKWYKEQRANNSPLTGPMIQAKAAELAKDLGYVNFMCSEGWLGRFKNRHGISLRAKAVASEVVSDQVSKNTTPPEQAQEDSSIQMPRIKEEVPWEWSIYSNSQTVDHSESSIQSNSVSQSKCVDSSVADEPRERSQSGWTSYDPVDNTEYADTNATMQWDAGELSTQKTRSNGELQGSMSRMFVDHMPEPSCESSKTENESNLSIAQIRGGVQCSEDTFVISKCTIFYRFLPAKYLDLKDEWKYGKKNSFTVFAGTNMKGGEKLPLLVVGKSKNPCCFEELLPVIYAAEEDFQCAYINWIKRIDLQFIRQQRSVTMLMDYDCPQPTTQLNSIKVASLPASTTINLRTSDRSVEKTLNSFYRRRLLQNVIQSLDNIQDFTLSVLKALLLLKTVWSRIRPEIIVDCYRSEDFSQLGFHPQTVDVSEITNVITISKFKEDYILPHVVDGRGHPAQGNIASENLYVASIS